MDRDELEKFIIEECDPNLTDLRWILDALSSAGLGVVPLEPSEKMLEGAAASPYRSQAIRAAIKKGNLL